ncbi:hypothetical protein [Priestia endophytica]|uniref:hypothetical protein n=1 Tax=Priestia endophytica TaxID=135735 RepID=UPI000F54843D|nr:hypothetical protein [Priestia endophytica]MED4074315.1 hypothetical protein [Priestia endophytica]RPK01858.1 hypothetical protein FH5_02279 [Priestia endophytica]
MKRVLLVFLVIGIIVGLGWGYFAFKKHQIAKEVENQLESRMDRQFTVTDIQSSKDESGSYYYVTVKMEGVKKPFTFQREKEAIANLYYYEVIEELWDSQYTQQIKEIVQNHRFNMRDIEGRVDIDRKNPINIKSVPNIQEVYAKYGQEVMVDTLIINLSDNYPLDAKQQARENEKVFNLLEDLRNHNMNSNLFLEVIYKEDQQTYRVAINDKNQDTYYKAEDMKKVLVKTKEQVEKTYKED